MAKNAGKTVQALLANAPAPPRAHVPPPVPTQQPDPLDAAHEDVAPDPESDTHAPLATTDTVVEAAQSPRRPRHPTSATPVEPSAPPTLRLSQPTAEALRAAWLTAKRDRVLLTYQDFAGEVIAAGLRGGDRRPAVGDKSSSLAGSSVPRTLRLSQPTAEALRAAWLTAKRDRVLLTYQDFAGEVIAAGLQHRLQH